MTNCFCFHNGFGSENEYKRYRKTGRQENKNYFNLGLIFKNVHIYHSFFCPNFNKFEEK